MKETYCSGHIQEVLCILQLSSSQWAYVGPTCKAKLLPPPPPHPLSPCPWIRDTKGAGGGVRVAAGHLPTPTLRQGFPRLWSVRYDNMPVTTDGSPFIIEEHPCKCAGVRDCFGQQQRSWGDGGGRGNQREEAWVRWGGGGEHMCGRLFEFASSLRKNYKAVTLEFSIHTFSGRLQLLLPSWSLALSRIDSRWKKCTLARHTYLIYLLIIQYSLFIKVTCRQLHFWGHPRPLLGIVFELHRSYQTYTS